MGMFEYVMVLASIIVGLGITQLLQGVAQIVEHPERDKLYWVHLVWAAYIFVSALVWWWFEFRFRAVSTWTMQLYLFVTGYAVLIYLLCAWLFPRDLEHYDGYKDYFYKRRGWFFGLLIIYYTVDLADTLLKGVSHFASYGLEYPIAITSYIVLCATAALTRNERFHGVFAVAIFLYQFSVPFRYFDTVS
jgi:hypothetical protein